MTNLFAYRSKSPRVMMEASDPIGPSNDVWLLKIALGAARVIIAWGADGDHLQRGHFARLLLRQNFVRFEHLGITKNGEPKHPLYLSRFTIPEKWTI